MKIFILGCGRVGARLTEELGGAHDITIMDWNEGAFERLPDSFNGTTIVGNGIDADALKSAGIRDADAFVAVTNGDNRNLVAAQIAKVMGVPQIIVRVYDPVRCHIYEQLGLTTISPTINGAQALFDMVVGTDEET